MKTFAKLFIRLTAKLAHKVYFCFKTTFSHRLIPLCPEQTHTLSIAFQHLPPDSAITGYATEGALLLFAQLSTDAVSALRKVWVLRRLWKWHSTQAPIRLGWKKRSSLSIQTTSVWFVLVQATWSVIKAMSDIIWVVCHKRICLSITEKLFVSRQFFRDLRRNKLWQWLEEGRRKPVVGVWNGPSHHHKHLF